MCPLHLGQGAFRPPTGPPYLHLAVGTFRVQLGLGAGGWEDGAEVT